VRPTGRDTRSGANDRLETRRKSAARRPRESEIKRAERREESRECLGDSSTGRRATDKTRTSLAETDTCAL